MKRRLIVAAACAFSACVPLFLLAESGTTDIRKTGAPVDGGATCAVCHNTFGAANSDPTGSMTIEAADYASGAIQTVHVRVAHPQAARWGFQITARFVSDETLEAGTFIPVNADVQVRCDDGTQLGSAAPCTSTREFAEHTIAPRTKTGAGYDFQVNWQPPPNEGGRVVFYASAVAGDDDGTAAGDRVYAASKTVSSAGTCSLDQRPSFARLLNAASGSTAFSSGSLVSIYGFNFQIPGRSRQVGLGDIANNSFPTELACVSVEVEPAGTLQFVRVPISYVQQDQINAQLPQLASVGPLAVRVVLNPDTPLALTTDLATLTTLQTFAPAFFTTNNQGTGTIAAQFANSAVPVAAPGVVMGGHPARPGDIITLYGTGFGDVSPALAPGAIATAAAAVVGPVSVTVGSIPVSPADLLYVGLSPGSISGLYQINLRVPANAPNGDLAVIATAGGFQSQAGATIPVQSQ